LRFPRCLRSPTLRRHLIAAVLFFAIGQRSGVAASDHYGQVTFAGLPVPGATVVAIQGDTKRTTVTDQQGVYRLGNLADGSWTIRVEMVGFSPLSETVMIPASVPPTFALKLLPFGEITAGLQPLVVEAPQAPAAPSPTVPASPTRGTAPSPPLANAGGGFQRARR